MPWCLRILTFTFLLDSAIIVFAGISSVQAENGSTLLALNDVNFDQVLNEKEVLFVSFYAPGCVECEKLEAELARAADLLAEQGSRAHIATVDTTQSPLLTRRFQIDSHPTFRLLGDVRSADTIYTGFWNAEAIVSWLLRRTGSHLRLFSVEDVEAFRAEHDAIVVAFLDTEEDGGEAALVVKEWADEEERVPVALTWVQVVLKHYGVEPGTVVMFKKGEPMEEAGITSVSQLQKWASLISTPLLLTLAEETYSEVFAKDDNTFLILFSRAEDGSERESSGEEEEAEDPKAVVKKVAKAWRGKVRFAWADWDSPQLQRVRDWLGVYPDTVPPVVRVLRSAKLRRYKPAKSEFSEEGVTEFLKQLHQGKIKPFLPSETLPEDWDSQPVKVLVGDNFDSVVMDKSRHVVVDLYAPWCGHCKRLEPILEQLGEKYKDSETVTIAKMDSTKNELSHIRPRSFPSIRMWKKDTNEVVEYNGERTLQGISRFIETNGEYGRGPSEDEDLGDEEIEYEEDLGDEDDWSQRHSEL